MSRQTRRNSGRHALVKCARDGAGWLLVLALFYAPWDFGGTSASAIRHLNWILAAAFVLWLVSRAGRGRSERAERNGLVTQWSLLAIGALILLIGWGVTLNAHSAFDADYSAFLSLTSL